MQQGVPDVEPDFGAGRSWTLGRPVFAFSEDSVTVEELEIGSLDCAGFVLARGVPLLRCVLRRSGYATFVFENDAGQASVARSEYYRNGLISGRKLHESMRILKRAAGPPPVKQDARRRDAEPDWEKVFEE